MPPVVSLRDVVEALDLQSDELCSYLDPDTGEIITFNREEADIARRGEWAKAPEWMRELLPRIKRALEDEHMLRLPDRVHIDEWRMMQDFAGEQQDEGARAALCSASQGAAAFRNFRKVIVSLGMEECWRCYRDQAMAAVARQWLEEKKLKYR